MATRVSLEPIEDGRVAVIKTALSGDRHDRKAEAEWLARARHRGVVRLLEFSKDPMEIRTLHAGGATLRTAHSTPRDAAELLTDAAVTIADLHDRGMAHGQITLDHLILDGRRIVLCSPTGLASDLRLDVEDLGHCIQTLLDRWSDTGVTVPELSRWVQLVDGLTDVSNEWSARQAARELARLSGHCDRQAMRQSAESTTESETKSVVAEALSRVLGATGQTPGVRGLAVAGVAAFAAICGSFVVLGAGPSEAAGGTEILIGGHRYQIGSSEHDRVLALGPASSTQTCPTTQRNTMSGAVVFLQRESGTLWLFASPGADAQPVVVVSGATGLAESSECGTVLVQGPAGQTTVDLNVPLGFD